MNWPSATQVLQRYVDFSQVPPDRLALAAERGTQVHEACAMYAQGLFSVMVLDNEIAGYVDSFRRWFDRVVDVVILCETRLLDEAMAFHGQPDILVKAKHGEILLVDYKTPVALSKSWRLQMAAYRHLCELAGHVPDRCGSLRLSPDGKAPKMNWYEEESAQDLNIFLCALNVHRFFNA